MSLMLTNAKALEIARTNRTEALKEGNVEDQIYWTGFVNGMKMRIEEGVDAAKSEYAAYHAKYENSDNEVGRIKAQGFLAAVNHFGC